MAIAIKRNPNQKGVVLIVSLVFLVALTSVVAALMTSTTLDMKMASASEDKVVAVQSALGSNDEAISEQVNKTGDVNNFALPLAQYPKQINVSDAQTTAQISTTLQVETDCPARKSASSVQLFKCNIVQLEVDKEYGRHQNSTVEVRTGIAQQLLNVGK